MSKIKRWPAMLYSDAGECQTFNSASDVPKSGDWGYYPVDHPKRGERRPAPAHVKAVLKGSEKRWPAWCVGPGGEEAIFNSAKEMPNGWEPKRKASVAGDERTSGISDKDAAAVVMTKAEAMEALGASNIEFDAKAKKLELVKLVLWAINEGKIEEE